MDPLQWMGAVRMRVQTADKNSLLLTNMQLFTLQDINDELESFGLLCLDSHSDGTHSLQRIHWWASDAMLHFYKSDEETNSSTSWMVWGWLHFQQNVIFGWTIHLRICEQGGRTTKTLNCKLTLQDHFSDIWHHANKCGTLEAIILSKWIFCRHLHKQRLQNPHFLL